MAEKYRYRVLVVDDEPMAVKAVCRVVERHCPAFAVAGEASNGKEALDKMAECLPDVVLTDIEMPVMNGLEMAGQAKEKHPSVRFEKEQKEKPKVDSPEFFQTIEEYLRANLAEPMSLQSVCDEFSISQAYVSKLFRKYAGQSFGQYLTRLRMEQAKSLMKDNPGLYIKLRIIGRIQGSVLFQPDLSLLHRGQSC